MRILLYPLLFVGQSFVFIGCYSNESGAIDSVRLARRRKVSSAIFYPTVQDIEDYLSGNHRAASSISVIKPTALLDEEATNWPKRVFSMETDAPAQSPIAPPSSCSNDLSRSEAILEILRSVTPEPTLLNTVTAQGMAYSWLVSEDPAAATTLINPCDHMMQIQQRYALVVLYYATSGDSWTDSSGWLTLEDECTWTKVTCHADEPTVSALTLSQNNLIGELPAEIKVFVQIEELVLFDNQLKGTIPESMGALQQLHTFDVERNSMSGKPFVTLYGLFNLRKIHLSDNLFDEQLSGPGMLNWELLQDLWLGNNLFRGEIPEEIGRMESLQSLLLYGNEFSGSLPSEIGADRLTEFIAHANEFNGFIPESIFNNIDLKILRLDENNFSGTISSAIGDLINIVELRIGQNQLNGTLPGSLWKLSKLTLLSLSSNKLSGSLADAFDTFVNLDTLDLAQNSFTNTVPSTLFALPTIRLVYLSNNNFTGPIPNNFGSAGSLRDLYLNDNQLEGPIPSILTGQLPNLNEFLLQSNSLTGAMPDSICALTEGAGVLEDLWADCRLVNGVAEVECACCTQCIFE